MPCVCVLKSEKKQRNLSDVPIPEELVEYLEANYPERCPDLNDTDRDIFFYAGSRHLVKRLRKALDSQRARAGVIQ